MAVKVITSKQAWDGFLRRAKHAFPSEHVECLWGEETVDSYRITHFKHIKIIKQNHNSVEYSDEETTRQRILAQEAGKVYLGTVHTHPRKDYDTSASTQDHIDGSKYSEKIMGIVVLFKKKDSERFVVEADWWVPQKLEFILLPE